MGNLKVSAELFDSVDLMKEYHKKMTEALVKGYDKEFLQKAQNSKVFASLAKVTAPASDKFGDIVWED